MRLGKYDRRAVKALGAAARRTAEYLISRETEEIFAFEEFCRALMNSPRIEFITFACLGTHRGKEEIRLELSETNFFKKFAKRADKLLKAVRELGNTTSLTIFLADLEPCRTWGWRSVTQEEISYYCREMVDASRHRLPVNWTVQSWSEVESQSAGVAFPEALEWARRNAHPLVVQGETEHIALFPEILLRRTVQEHALIQVASYALEGKTLEAQNPNFILLQTEFPARRKDQMYQPLRSRRLPIIHPFPLGER